MSTVIDVKNMSHTLSEETVVPNTGIRSAVLIYSLVSYVVGLTGLVWLILAMGGLVPYGFGPVETGSVTTALLVNAGLVALFGLQHSIMVRRSFMEKLTRIIPEPAERSTFVLASGIVMTLAVWCWQPVPGIVWSVESNIAKWILWSFYLAGWGYLVVSTFVTNHIELFGLRQVWLYFRGIPHTPVKFVNIWMYSYSRHPMMPGILAGMWSIPVMSVSHLIFSLTLSTYIVIGVLFEERDLVNQFGDTYKDYKKEMGTFFTLSK